jgi:hypothetical protein
MSTMPCRRTMVPQPGSLLRTGPCNSASFASCWLPGWATFVRVQGMVLMLVLALVPIVATWNAQTRRLSGPLQLKSNLWGAVLGAIAVAGGVVLAR